MIESHFANIEASSVERFEENGIYTYSAFSIHPTLFHWISVDRHLNIHATIDFGILPPATDPSAIASILEMNFGLKMRMSFAVHCNSLFLAQFHLSARYITAVALQNHLLALHRLALDGFKSLIEKEGRLRPLPISWFMRKPNNL